MATYSRKLKDSSGNYIVPVTRSKVVYFDDNSTLSKLTFFPVGAIYQSTGSTSPASLFGGSWEKIQGKFLLGSSSSHSVASTGGEETHKLSIQEMPYHNHKWQTNYQDTEDYLMWDRWTWYPNPCYQVETTNRKAAAGSTTNEGGNQPHNNMPPYYVVNIWRRTA